MPTVGLCCLEAGSFSRCKGSISVAAWTGRAEGESGWKEDSFGGQAVRQRGSPPRHALLFAIQ